MNKKKIVLISICIVVCLVIFLVIFLLNKRENIKVKSFVEIEIGDKITVDKFFEISKGLDKESKIEIYKDGEIVDNFNEVGEYNVKIIDSKNDKTYESKLNIIDITPPVAETKDLTLDEEVSVKPEDFIESCTDNSGKECIIKFKEDYNLSKEEQELYLIVSDNSDNASEYLVKLKRNLKDIIVKFDCACNTKYEPITVKKGDLVPEPAAPKDKSNAYFVGWTLNGKIFDFYDPVTKNITLKAKYSKANWKVLWVVLAEINYDGNSSKISKDTFNKYKITGSYFEKFIEKSVPSLNIVNSFAYETTPLKKITKDETNKYVVNKDIVMTTLKKFNYEKYDSVLLIGNMTPYRSELPYGGLTWGTDYYSFIPDYNHLAGNPNSHDVFIHEWLHQVESFYGDNLGYNVPNLHDNATYGFTEENERGWKDWYAAYLSNKLKGGPSTGINKEWWKETPTQSLD